MLKMILMTQLFFTDGTYEFRNFDVLVRTEKECHDMAPRAIHQAELISEMLNGRKPLQQTGYSCTDMTVELDFWPIPEWIPRPVPRPVYKGLTI